MLVSAKEISPFLKKMHRYKWNRFNQEETRVNQKQLLYHDLARTINRTLGRTVVTVEGIHRTVEEAKRVRQTGGTMALLQYVNGLSERLFSPVDVEKLKQSPRRTELSNRMLDLLVLEKVLTPGQAMMLKGMVR
jgi:hypothetical protein